MEDVLFLLKEKKSHAMAFIGEEGSQLIQLAPQIELALDLQQIKSISASYEKPEEKGQKENI